MLEKKVVRMTLTDFYLGVICIFPLATVLVDEGIVNKFLFALLVGLQIGMLFDRRVRKRTFLLLFCLLISFVYSLSNTKFPMTNANLLFYFPFYLVYTYFVCDNKETVLYWFSKNKTFVTAVLVIWTVLVGFSILLPSSYYIKEGGGRYFGSFTQSIFRLGQAAMFIQALTIMLQAMHGSKKAFIFNFVPMFSYFMGSSRTYLVVGLCLMVVSWYLFCSNKKIFWYSVIPIGVLVLILLGSTSMGDKIAYTLDEDRYGDFWFRITSSRSLLWELDMEAWKQLPLLSKFLGGSLNFTYEASERWGHNDFIEIICSFGIAGIVQYLYSIGILFSGKSKGRKMPFIVGFALIMAWFFNAFFNMHYVYFCAMLCYPFLVLGIKYHFDHVAPPAAPKKTPKQDKLPGWIERKTQ